ncbi:hypothetical protein PIB30_041818 [Stylosanthes scabra]|uniref:Uncharacterized protein n=1 Tax=Stylosanthes scabra TaxID=79078 RepID=A0ABU6ZDT7_9FABA|nr:hypothetical protein [Stylosanthes scabra]
MQILNKTVAQVESQTTLKLRACASSIQQVEALIGDAEKQKEDGRRVLKAGLICGGPSAERGIFLNSARSVLDHIQTDERTDVMNLAHFNGPSSATSRGTLSHFSMNLSPSILRPGQICSSVRPSGVRQRRRRGRLSKPKARRRYVLPS